MVRRTKKVVALCAVNVLRSANDRDSKGVMFEPKIGYYHVPIVNDLVTVVLLKAEHKKPVVAPSEDR